VEEVRWVARIFHIILIGIAAYLCMGLSFRPVERALASQKRFIANLSHELKTPLAVAKTETEVALRRPELLTREEAIVLLKGNMQHINHISRVIQFLLVLSDFDGSRGHIKERLVALDDVLERARVHIQDAADHKQVTLTIENHAEEVSILGNAVALEKMVLNLLRNAVAHTPAGGNITVSLEREAGKLRLSVADTGTGIPAKDLPHIFEPFYRAGNAVVGGSGLGLSIVKEVARAHKISIKVESEQGKGTRFILTTKL